MMGFPCGNYRDQGSGRRSLPLPKSIAWIGSTFSISAVWGAAFPDGPEKDFLYVTVNLWHDSFLPRLPEVRLPFFFQGVSGRCVNPPKIGRQSSTGRRRRAPSFFISFLGFLPPETEIYRPCALVIQDRRLIPEDCPPSVLVRGVRKRGFFALLPVVSPSFFFHLATPPYSVGLSTSAFLST